MGADQTHERALEELGRFIRDPIAEIKACRDRVHPGELRHAKWPTLPADIDTLIHEVDRLTHLHQLDHSLADQHAARIAELERRLARAMGAIANYDTAFAGLGGTSDQMDDAEADGKALLAAYAEDHSPGEVGR